MSKVWPEWQPEDIASKLKAGEKLTIIDVREPDEWFLGHIPEAKHIPLGQIPTRIHEIDPKVQTILVCRSGGRSGRACEYLHSLGYNVVNMTGGMMEWPGEKNYGDSYIEGK